ncbi:MAG: hypothetical protein HYR76_05540 [Ignavibacteria bacterium]|nr:hypothetical protein [Ignavibacteria bacterium]MBI3764976.1 hypothetical protein [Ignavibacteriales bacterium]
MRRFLAYLMSISSLVSALTAQTVSPLYQVMSSNSSIRRPAEFRDMQDYIEQNFGDVKPGLRLDYFYDKLSAARTMLMAKIQTPQVRAKNDTLIFTVDRFSFSVPASTIRKVSKILDHTEEQLADALKKSIDTLFLTLSFSPQEQRAVITSLLTMLRQTGVEGDVILGNSTQDLSKSISSILLIRARAEMESIFPERPLYKNYTNIDTLRDDLQLVFDKITGEVRDRITQVLDKAEHELAKTVLDASNKLLQANIGLGVTEGTGAFNGGMLYTFKLSAWLKGGLYINGQFHNSDTTGSATDTLKPSESLVGLQIRGVFDRAQIDLLGSKLIGNHMNSAWEFGLGASARTNNDIIIGLAIFSVFPEVLQLNNENSTYTLGATLRGTAADSPSLLFGAVMQKDKKTVPVFQISFPILPSR